jgi:hypothetical protein
MPARQGEGSGARKRRQTDPHPEALAALPLRTLELRMVPDLTGLPPLTVWPELASFLGWNIDATVGKRLRTDLKKRGLVTQWETTAHGGRTTSSVWQVSRLRTPSWFVTESGLPCTTWPRRTAKQAVTAFRTAAKILDRTGTAGTDRHTAARQAIEGSPGRSTKSTASTRPSVRTPPPPYSSWPASPPRRSPNTTPWPGSTAAASSDANGRLEDIPSKYSHAAATGRPPMAGA